MALQTTFPGPSGLADSTMIRKGLAGLVLRDTSGNSRPGIFPRTSSSIASVVAGTWTLSIGKFEGCAVRGGGPLFMANDAAATTPANTSQAPVSNSRIDILYAVQHESAAPYADADNNTVFGWVYGTPGASPVKNSAGLAAIAGAVELLTVQVPSTATSSSSAGVTVTETYQYTALQGGRIRVRTATDLTALTAFETDQRAIAWDTGIIYRWNGSAWKAWESDWIAYGATLTNFNIGTGGAALNSTDFKWDAGRLRVRFRLYLGSSGATVGSQVVVTMPSGVTLRAPSTANLLMDGKVTLFQGASTNLGHLRYSASNTDRFEILANAATAGGLAIITSSSPWNWAAGNGIEGELIVDVQ
jgi:hypothetical protein